MIWSGLNERNCLYCVFPPMQSIHSAVGVLTCLMNRNLPVSPCMESSVFFSMIRPLCLYPSDISHVGFGFGVSVCFFLFDMCPSLSCFA